MTNILFSPIQIGGVISRNRISFEPMGNHYAELDGSVSQRDIDFYKARAAGGCGIIMTETCSVNSKNGRANTRNLCLDRDELIPSFNKLANAVHAAGSLLFIELYHPGRQGIAALNGGVMLAPSEIMCNFSRQPVRAMTTDEVQALRNDFISAAVRAKKSGADGVAIHAAHGYLINQFLSPYTNRRTDQYGGSFDNRFRFLGEILDGIREECGESFPIIPRLTVDEMLESIGIDGGIHLPEGTEIAKRCEECGAVAIDVSCGIYETMNTSWEPCGYDQGWKIYLAQAVKSALNIPVIAVSVIRDPEFAEKLLNDGSCDIVGSARQFFCDPEWGNKVKSGRSNEIRRCISCLNCMETLFASGKTGIPCQCAVNIEAGEEFSLHISDNKNGDGNKIAIIGAGPAGLECARVLALRGFKPVIFEKSDKIGGQLNIACKPPKKDKLSWLIDYYASQLNALNIELKLNSQPSAAELKADGFKNVVFAAGSTPVRPRSIPGIEGENVLTPPQILSGAISLTGKKICVVGSGMTGIETAELLVSQGNTVSLWEMADNIGPGLFFQNLTDVLSRIDPEKCSMHPASALVSIGEKSAEFKSTITGEVTSDDFDYIVVSLGVRPITPPDELATAFPNMTIIGDSQKGGRIRHAAETGYFAGYNMQ